MFETDYGIMVAYFVMLIVGAWVVAVSVATHSVLKDFDSFEKRLAALEAAKNGRGGEEEDK